MGRDHAVGALQIANVFDLDIVQLLAGDVNGERCLRIASQDYDFASAFAYGNDQTIGIDRADLWGGRLPDK